MRDMVERLDREKDTLLHYIPEYLREGFRSESYISGGCIYSLYNNKDPKDYDFFVHTESLANELRDYYLSLVVDQDDIEYKSVNIVHYGGERIVVTKNAISIGNKYQIITKFTGTPKEVVEQFDFKHNMFYYHKGLIMTLSDWDYLDSNQLVYNEQRARDISGTIIRIPRFIERGMKITNEEVCKMLRKLKEVGFTEREDEIIENTYSY